MKKIGITLCLLAFFIGSSLSQAQTQPVTAEKVLEKPYNPAANAQLDIDKLVLIAKSENKHIILQAGGNWCIWCLRFNQFIQETPDIHSFLADNYLYYHLNFSKENKNEAVFKKYAPEGAKLGYPFFIVLDADGKVLKIQDSGSFEAAKSYDIKKVLSFFKTWKPN